jgi:serine/tyrosine/threonine adenylyltransferase
MNENSSNTFNPHSPSAAPISFDNSYARLSAQFFSQQLPTPVTAPTFIRVNTDLAYQLRIDLAWLESTEALQVFAGNRVPAGAEPIATAYAGHQFGGWNPQLGDGRAILLGEVIGSDGRRYDIQLKGGGQTQYSRMGDGRSPLGPVLREYIVSEAMAAFGVPTTRSLAAVASGETVRRDNVLPGAVLTRVASSHIRIGTFQYFAGRNDIDAVRTLADYVIARHYPELEQTENSYGALLETVIARQAQLIAQWQHLGFIHGVMNTDNMLVCGETIDYGPCAFMDAFNPNQVYSSIDRQGRYAFRNQPPIALWNLSWLAQSLLPLLVDNFETSEGEQQAVAIAQAALDIFSVRFEMTYTDIMLKKIGLTTSSAENIALLEDLLKLMAENGTDYTLTFRRLAELTALEMPGSSGISALFELPESFADWIERWHEHTAEEKTDAIARQQSMFEINPAFIPRNHLIEEAIVAAMANDFQPFHQLVEVLAEPYRYDAKFSRYALPPTPEQIVKKTFCGT